ncbi:ATP-binding protein [Desulfobacter latus]|uniref:ATP-binding protein n=1 Tax=Desulfobacter latus TaxID=2292 RepID=A0A850T9N5_9BACT|nr:DUF4143 domain-containing protein [Desulfobacter latus]NWH06282.1 ATP-binding protein [Desulfobacter latus]
MKRFGIEYLKEWKVSPDRKPLVVKGIRQVGKTWLLKSFGERCFKDTAYFNFEENRSLDSYFAGDINPDRIVDGLSILHGKRIIPNETLLVFDEIQESNAALNSLKYFHEKLPEQHIACAGSLLGITLSKPGSFPVGKVNFFELKPFSFLEFLYNFGEEMLVEYFQNIELTESVPLPIFNKCIELLKTYFLVGGMPEPLATWIDTRDIDRTERRQKEILQAYELDFSKHAPHSDIPKLHQIWRAVPSLLSRENRKFVYSVVRKGARAREYENAISWLESAGLIYKIHRVSKPALPLISYTDSQAFKLFFPDVGLLRVMSQLHPGAFVEGNRLFTEFKGALAENYILQELVSGNEASDPHYWTSKATAEVEFIIQVDNSMIPIEVKSGVNVRSKSLKIYRDKYNPDLAIRSSLLNLKQENKLLNIPLFLAFRIPDFCRTLLVNRGFENG